MKVHVGHLCGPDPAICFPQTLPLPDFTYPYPQGPHLCSEESQELCPQSQADLVNKGGYSVSSTRKLAAVGKKRCSS